MGLCHASIVTVNCEGSLRPYPLAAPKKNKLSLGSRIKGGVPKHSQMNLLT